MHDLRDKFQFSINIRSSSMNGSNLIPRGKLTSYISLYVMRIVENFKIVFMRLSFDNCTIRNGLYKSATDGFDYLIYHSFKKPLCIKILL